MNLGILGSGQLGQMLCHAASRLGIHTAVYAPTPGPANLVADNNVVAAWDDAEALERFVRSVDVVTYELEHLPESVVAATIELGTVRPSLRALQVARNRATEKECCVTLGIPVAPYRVVDAPTSASLREAAEAVGYPCLVKTQTLGYDGKGQFLLAQAQQVDEAVAAMAGAPCVVEKRLELRRELSLLGVRSATGELRVYPPVENVHRHGILRTSRSPAEVHEGELRALHRWVELLATHLDYVGLITLEIFDTAAGWYLNEIAPRVHNSGHLTIEGAECSQFENHVRAVMGLPLGSTAPRGSSAMINLIGGVPSRKEILAVEGAHLHLYGKEARRGRKLGHITVVAPSPEVCEQRCQRLAALADGAAVG